MSNEEDQLKEMIKQVRQQKAVTDANTEGLKDLKDKLRVFMVDSGIKNYDGLEIRRSFSSFDIELLRLEKPKLFEKYCTREELKIVTFENSIDKKMLKLLSEEHPELWTDPDYREEKTARLYGL